MPHLRAARANSPEALLMCTPPSGAVHQPEHQRRDGGADNVQLAAARVWVLQGHVCVLRGWLHPGGWPACLGGGGECGGHRGGPCRRASAGLCAGGSITCAGHNACTVQVDHRLDVVRVELYNTPADKARYAFEIIMSVWICAMMLQNLWQIGLAQVKQGNFMKVGGVVARVGPQQVCTPSCPNVAHGMR